MQSWMRALLQTLAPDHCPGCDVQHPIGADGFCDVCAPLLERHERGLFAFEYGGPMAEAIQRLKYHGRVDLAAPLGALLADFARSATIQIDTVVPIPLHPKRLVERGFNQSALLAHEVAKRYHLRLDLRVLRRSRATLEQTSLAADMRAENVSEAFCAGARSQGKSILLIDDVHTTGSTMDAARSALLRAGARRVATLALAGRDS